MEQHYCTHCHEPIIGFSHEQYPDTLYLGTVNGDDEVPDRLKGMCYQCLLDEVENVGEGLRWGAIMKRTTNEIEALGLTPVVENND